MSESSTTTVASDRSAHNLVLASTEARSPAVGGQKYGWQHVVSDATDVGRGHREVLNENLGNARIATGRQVRGGSRQRKASQIIGVPKKGIRFAKRTPTGSTPS